LLAVDRSTPAATANAAALAPGLVARAFSTARSEADLSVFCLLLLIANLL
jgi:hypothetical protein